MVLQLFPATGFGDHFWDGDMVPRYAPFCSSLSTRPGRRSATCGWSAGVPLDIVEHKDKYSLKADVPGMSPEDIHVELQDRVLTVSGEKKVEVERNADEKGVRTYRKERTFNKFTRSFVLPDDSLAEGIAAHVNNGVLTLDIPKKPEEPPKITKIPVLGSAKPAAQIEGTAAATCPTNSNQ